MKVILIVAALATGVCGALTGCASGRVAGDGRIAVVAAESVWGSLVEQVGGDRARVATLIGNPDTDPHAYEPTPADARLVSDARYVVVNGAGYDPWASRLLDATQGGPRTVLGIDGVAGRHDGDNPHMWYSPPIVLAVIARVAADLGALDPADAAYFSGRAATLRTQGLAAYGALRSTIRSRHAGVPVGATESLVVDLTSDLGLNLVTPPAYLRAVAEGNEPTASDRIAIDAQIDGHQIAALLFNTQNSTPGVQSVVDRARAAGIPVVEVTESLTPRGATFQDWQSAQLRALSDALAQDARP